MFVKRFKYILLLLLLISTPAFANTEIRYNESLLPYKGGILISNYGTDSLHPKNDEFKGYILYYKNRRLNEFIPAKGNLKAPTAMTVYQNKLFVCDRDKLWVYNLKNLNESPQKILFAPNDKILNDIVLSKDELFVTTTDTNRIYKINLKSKILRPEKWIDIPSPNGIAVRKDTIYIVSIPADFTNVKEENVIYVIKDKKNPVVEKFNTIPRMHDGIAVSKDGKALYVSDWNSSSVISVDVKTKEEKTVYHKGGLTPTDIFLKGNKLLIPDELHHRVIIYNLKNHKEEVIR